MPELSTQVEKAACGERRKVQRAAGRVRNVSLTTATISRAPNLEESCPPGEISHVREIPLPIYYYIRVRTATL